MRWRIDGRQRAAAWLLALLCAAAALLVVWLTASGQAWLRTDMDELFPADRQTGAVQQRAQKLSDERLNSRMVALAGAPSLTEARQAAQSLARLWRQSGVFAAVSERLDGDAADSVRVAERLQTAFLPTQQVQMLQTAPQQYFDRRAQDLANPFAAPSLLPADRDWLGFGRFFLPKIQAAGKMQWDEATGVLYTENGGAYWVMVWAELPQKAGWVGVPDGLLPLLHQSQQLARQAHWQLKIAGGAVFAAESKARAQTESLYMSLAGVVLTLGLLFVCFRSPSMLLWVLVPVGAGSLLGLAACLAVFDHIHVLTLVIGTSLVGVLADFPLHVLVPGRLAAPTAADERRRRLRTVFACGFIVTASGYVLLTFAPLSVLRQTAVFSVAALAGALWATLAWLPEQPRRVSGSRAAALPLRLTRAVMAQTARLKRYRKAVALLLLVLLASGVWRAQVRDDVRTWAHLSPQWLAQAQDVAAITGPAPPAQFLIVDADSPQALWEKDARVSRALDGLPANSLDGYQSLSGYAQPPSVQRQVRQRLRQLADEPQNWQSMRALGVSDSVMRRALLQAAALPEVPLPEVLGSVWGRGAAELYLGEVLPGRYASLIRLQGVHRPDAVQAAARQQGVYAADRITRLNQLFAQTRDHTLWLKLTSFALAWLVLAVWLGKRRAARVIAMPLLAAACTAACLAAAGVTLGLFVMFGLLLVSAIGVDYALCLDNVPPDAAVERTAGVLAAAATTWISFALLGLSSTPVVAAFGQTVAAGVVWNVLAALWLLPENMQVAKTAWKTKD